VIDLSGMSCLRNIQEIWNMSCLSVCDIVFHVITTSYTTSYSTTYTILWCYLWIFIQEMMANDLEGLASRLWPPVEQTAFPFDATKRAKMTVGTPNNVMLRSAAVHLSSFLSGISISSERLAPIHSASLVGSQHKTG
jgi:hypothetical protein